MYPREWLDFCDLRGKESCRGVLSPQENSNASSPFAVLEYRKNKRRRRREEAVASIAQMNLFIWNHIDAASDLQRLRLVLDAMPDEELMRTLERERRGRRDDYPIRAVWNSLLAGVIYGHAGIESLRRELLEVCGFDPVLGARAVSPSWVYTRLVKKVRRHRDLVERMVDQLVDDVAAELPDLGRRIAVDSKGMRTHARGRKDPAESADPDADWGVRAYRETRKMVYGGFEEERRCLKYRCPAAHYGIVCAGRRRCSPTEYGKVVRISLDDPATDRRLFVPVPRHTLQFTREYKKRTAIERVNSWLGMQLGFDVHFVRGMTKMRLKAGLAVAVMLSMALAQVRRNRLTKMRTLLAA
jgi:hypothetical protein